MDVVIHHPGCDLEDVLKKCPDLTWNQVFITVDQLSRQGYVSVRVGNGRTEPRHDAYSCAKEKELDVLMMHLTRWCTPVLLMGLWTRSRHRPSDRRTFHLA